jgi:hypothetical protein
MEGIEKLKWLLAHKNGERRLDELFRILVELGLEKWDPKRREARREKREKLASHKSLPTSEVECQPCNAAVKRHMRRSIPAKVRDEVWQRDGSVCQYRDPVTGKRCGSRHMLEIDHTIPVARGGTNDASNLRLLCRQHNIFTARKVFGDRLIDRKIREQLSRLVIPACRKRPACRRQGIQPGSFQMRLSGLDPR